MTSPTSRMPGPASPDSGARSGGSAAKPPEVEEWVDQRIHRPLARRVVALLVRTPITPNQVTLLSALVGVAAALAVARGAHEARWCAIGGVLLFVSVVLDCCDGQLARARQVSSTYGAILDGVADYVVGASIGIGAGYFMATVHHSRWYWLLALAGIASSAVQSALFDHAKTRYLARVGGGYSEREEDPTRLAAERQRAWRERRLKDALLLAVYLQYSRAQQSALRIPPAADPVAHRAAHAGRMRAWTWLGIGTHFALAYLLCFLAIQWPGAIASYFVICTIPLNLYLLLLLRLEARAASA